jgi:hypothetical protein
MELRRGVLGRGVLDRGVLGRGVLGRGVLGREVFKLDSQRAPGSAEWKVCSPSSLGDGNPVYSSRVGLGTSLALSFCGPYHASQRLGRTVGSAVANIVTKTRKQRLKWFESNKGWRLPESQGVS